jgi:DNA polymerase type B, organellar and viral
MKVIIEETHESEAHKKSSHAARGARRRQVRTEPLRFVCVDGEGQTLADGSHRYVLLGVGDQQISDPGGLDYLDIFAFLYSQFQTGSVCYSGFFLTYDFTQWLRSLPEYQARRLLDSKERAKRKRRIGHNGENLSSQEIYFPVDIHGWEFDILGNKRFKLRPKGESRWMYICDTGGFFQKSFLKVIDPAEWKEPVVSPEEYKIIEEGKSRRDDAVLDDDMMYYNRVENRAHSRVLGELDKGFRELGIHLSPKQWFGPGQAAQAWLEGRAPTSKEIRDIIPPWFLEAARESYIGGWFEIPVHGIVPGVSYEYDINSAYPFIISRLPCLRHGQYARSDSIPVQDKGVPVLHLVRATVWSSKSQEVPAHYNHYIGAMLHRDGDGNISRPLKTEGWYWHHELEAARNAGILKGYDTREVLSYYPCNCAPPFAEIQDVYDLRIQVGKKTPLGIACKLMPNSLYGKFAQSVGTPKFGNSVYASLITAGCRTMILEAIGSHPKGKSDVLMVATDGVYFRTPHPGLECNGNLGSWDSNIKSNLCLFKPGVYWDDATRESIRSGESPVFKARGVSARYFARALEDIDRQFTRMREDRSTEKWPCVDFTLDFSVVSAVQALARGKWETAGTVNHDVPATQSSNPVKKRMAAYWDGDILRSKPPKNLPFEACHPYMKRFGMEDPFSQESEEQQGITPEGNASELWKQVLYP